MSESMQHTPGALRAAEVIVSAINDALVAQGRDKVLEPITVVPEFAAIIDRETHAPELHAVLITAMEQLDECGRGDNLENVSENIAVAYERGRAAIALVEGVQS